MTIKILIADDHAVVRQGLHMFLSLDPELEIVGEAADGRAAVEQVKALHPDVVLMDLLMPVMDGLTAISAIKHQMPEVEVVALTSVLDDSSVVKAIQAGAIGYLLKDTESQELISAIKAAARGQVQLSPKVAVQFISEMRPPKHNPDTLTEREMDVLKLLASGASNKEIGQKLTIGEKTVKTHVSNILSKFNVASRTQAVLHAIHIGLVTIDED